MRRENILCAVVMGKILACCAGYFSDEPIFVSVSFKEIITLKEEKTHGRMYFYWRKWVCQEKKINKHSSKHKEYMLELIERGIGYRVLACADASFSIRIYIQKSVHPHFFFQFFGCRYADSMIWTPLRKFLPLKLK